MILALGGLTRHVEVNCVVCQCVYASSGRLVTKKYMIYMTVYFQLLCISGEEEKTGEKKVHHYVLLYL